MILKKITLNGSISTVIALKEKVLDRNRFLRMKDEVRRRRSELH